MSEQAENNEKKPHLVSSERTDREPVIRAAEVQGYERLGLPEFVAPVHMIPAAHPEASLNESERAQAQRNPEPDFSPAMPSPGRAPVAPSAAAPVQAPEPVLAPGPAPEPVPAVAVIDEAELARIREEGFQVGYRRGHEEGLEAGHKVGYQQGRQDGQKAGHQVGEEAGFAEGLVRGEQQARAASEQEIRETLSTLQDAVAKLTAPTAQQEEAVVHELVGLVMTIAEHVVQRELHYDSGQIAQVVRRALSALPPSADGVRIHLNQRDLERIEQLRRDMDATWQVVVDVDMAPGGCRVETLDTIVDATTEQRMRQCVEQLAAEFLHEEPKEAARSGAALPEGDVPDEPSPADPTDTPTA